MKKTILLPLCLSVLLISCSGSNIDKGTKNKLTGKWKLVEALADPGDGSGTFQPVESEKTIEFRNDGTLIVSNGFLCPGASQSVPATGTYSVREATISPQNCESVLNSS